MSQIDPGQVNQDLEGGVLTFAVLNIPQVTAMCWQTWALGSLQPMKYLIKEKKVTP